MPLSNDFQSVEKVKIMNKVESQLYHKMCQNSEISIAKGLGTEQGSSNTIQ